MTDRVAVIQMVSGGDVDANLAAAYRLLAEARDRGARLAVLPENFAVFGGRAAVDWLASQRPGQHVINRWLSETAQGLGLWIAGGSVPWLPDEFAPEPVLKVFSSCGLYDPAGACLARYNKMHLFDVDVDDAHGSYRESDDFLPGSQPVVAETPLGRLGLAICYDLRFPELFRRMRAGGAELFCLPSAFTRVTTEAHWLPLLQARAIENQCFVLAANQGGRHSETRETGGQSCIISPWGEVLAVTGLGEAVVIADLDREALRAIRSRMPVEQHRRPDLR